MMPYTPDTAGILALVVQVFLPLIIGLVTKSSTPAGVKAVLLLALTAVTQFFTAWYQGSGSGEVFAWRLVAWNGAIGFGLSVITHFGLWRPTGATGVAQRSLNAD